MTLRAGKKSEAAALPVARVFSMFAPAHICLWHSSLVRTFSLSLSFFLFQSSITRGACLCHMARSVRRGARLKIKLRSLSTPSGQTVESAFSLPRQSVQCEFGKEGRQVKEREKKFLAEVTNGYFVCIDTRIKRDCVSRGARDN